MPPRHTRRVAGRFGICDPIVPDGRGFGLGLRSIRWHGLDAIGLLWRRRVRHRNHRAQRAKVDPENHRQGSASVDHLRRSRHCDRDHRARNHGSDRCGGVDCLALSSGGTKIPVSVGAPNHDGGRCDGDLRRSHGALHPPVRIERADPPTHRTRRSIFHRTSRPDCLFLRQGRNLRLRRWIGDRAVFSSAAS